jgi:hypothetical protein
MIVVIVSVTLMDTLENCNECSEVRVMTQENSEAVVGIVIQLPSFKT